MYICTYSGLTKEHAHVQMYIHIYTYAQSTHLEYVQTNLHAHTLHVDRVYLIHLVGGLGPHEGRVGFGRCGSQRFTWWHYLLINV